MGYSLWGLKESDLTGHDCHWRCIGPGMEQGSDTSRLSQVSGAEEIVSILDSLGVGIANMHILCSLEVTSLL